MKPQDYKALEIFVMHVDNRFKGMEDTIRNYLEIVKKNRNEIDKLHKEIGEIVEILAVFKNDAKDAEDNIRMVHEEIGEMREEMKKNENLRMPLDEKTPLTDVVEKIMGDNTSVPIENDVRKEEEIVPDNITEGMNDEKNDSPEEPIKIKHGIYTKEELRKMDWHLLKKLAGSLGCKKINGSRDFYTKFVMNQQSIKYSRGE